MTTNETVTITTNGHWRELQAACEFTAAELEHCGLDYIKDDEIYSPRLFRFRGWIYDIREFFVISETFPGGWHGHQSDSYFSGVVVRYDNDYERIQVGSYYVH